MSSDYSIDLSLQSGNYRWYFLALGTITGALVATIQFSCMPVLFKEISEDLDLNLVQIGTIWGFGNLAGLFVSILAGLLSDKFGIKLVLSVFCILVGITGALRGLADSYFTLALFMFLNGIARLVVPVTVTKAIGLWFKGKNLALAIGIGAGGMGLGLMLGPMLSATIMSPWLNGWRNVLFFYGAIAVGVGILWILFGREPVREIPASPDTETTRFRQTLSRLIRLKGLWLVGFTLFCRVGAIMGMTGYLPLYLQDELGWETAAADGTLSVFYGMSTLCVVPLAFLSDRIGLRKPILYIGIFVFVVFLGILPLVDGGIIWILMIVSGIFMDGFLSITSTVLLETSGVGAAASGTALGFAFTIAHVGNVSSPPIGNSLEAFSAGAPFYFWAALSLMTLIPVLFIKETGWRGQKA
jgi:MFS family permease